MNDIQIKRVTRDEILPLVSFSSILSPYETESDDIFYLITENSLPIGYLSARQVAQNKILTTLTRESVLYISGMEIKKGYKNKGFGTLLFDTVRQDFQGLDILIYATRFSISFWMRQHKAKEIDSYGKGKYIYFEKTS